MNGPPPVAMRLAAAADVPALAAIYSRAAAVLGPQVYGAEQVRAWESFGRDSPDFRRYILTAQTWIADADGRSLGFCGIDVEGEVHSLYVDPDHGRRGLGSRLLAHALEHMHTQGLAHFEVWATPFSRPIFERAGFALHEVRREPYQGVVFERYRLHRG